MRGAASIKVNKPIEEGWEFISDMSNSDQWLDGISEPVLATEGGSLQGPPSNANTDSTTSPTMCLTYLKRLKALLEAA